MNYLNPPSPDQLFAIHQLLQKYFDGLYQGDLHLLGQVFHTEARYVCACDGEWLCLDMPSYFHRVANRPTPASTEQPRQDRIIAIEYAGPETALAIVNCAIGNRYFTDFLSLVFSQDRWQIIAKVFHYRLTDIDGSLQP